MTFFWPAQTNQRSKHLTSSSSFGVDLPFDKSTQSQTKNLVQPFPKSLLDLLNLFKMKFWIQLSFKGFGSFVEKTVMPYISTTPAKLLNPCTGDQNCTSPFSYKNVLKLTSDGKKFNTLVGQQHISGNLDSPEGGFDAIMQVAVCGVSKKKKNPIALQWSCWKYSCSGSQVKVIFPQLQHLLGGI